MITGTSLLYVYGFWPYALSIHCALSATSIKASLLWSMELLYRPLVVLGSPHNAKMRAVTKCFFKVEVRVGEALCRNPYSFTDSLHITAH